MFVKRQLPIFLALAIACLGQAELRAQKVLEYLPEDALGFAMVQDLSDFNGKAEKLIEIFEVPFPAPLTFVQFATGLSDGLNLEGDLLMALLPGPSNSPAPQPMVLLPVDDYSKFSASVNGDETGEICRVTVAGEEVLIAKQGPFAVLMNVEHRETLEVMLGLEPSPVVDLKSIDSWIEGNDVTAAIMPEGVKQLLGQANAGIDAQQERYTEQFSEDDEDFQEVAKQIENSLAMTRWLLTLLEDEVKMAAVGLAIDEQLNVRLADRVLLHETGTLAKAKQLEVDSKSLLAGYADQLYVFAAGGPFPENAANSLAQFSIRMMNSMSAAYGLEDLSEEKWDELETAYREMMQGMKHSTGIMLPGEEGQPLFSNIYGITKVTNANDMLDTYRRAMETWNEIMSHSTSDILLQYEITPTTLDGNKACELVLDVAGAAQAPGVPTFNWLLESMFGEDGKLRQMMVAVDKELMVYGMADKSQLTAMIAKVKEGETSLNENKQVQVTAKLLSERAPWKVFINPTGSMKWVGRFVNEFLANLNGQTQEIPDFPVCPPIGISVNLADARFEGEMVWSHKTLKALAEYIKLCKNL